MPVLLGKLWLELGTADEEQEARAARSIGAKDGSYS
jgi:hypothetical protein